MTFTGNEDHSISLNDATGFTARYRETMGTDFLGGFFGKSAISEILNQTGCVGIRIYNAIDDKGENCYVLVGADSDENDMYDGKLAEVSLGCPPKCPEESPLAGTD